MPEEATEMMQNMSPELLLRMTTLEGAEREQRAVRWAEQSRSRVVRRNRRRAR